MGYHCTECSMSINDLICTECECKLEDNAMELDGIEVQVAECPDCHKKIKSPQCCGQDMASDE